MRSANEIIKEFLDKRDGVEITLPELSETAKVLRDQQDKCNAAEGDIERLKGDIENLRAERETLKAQYAETLFEGNAAALQAKLVKRRNGVDQTIAEHEREITRLGRWAEENQPDAHEVARIAVELDLMRTPDPFTFTEELKRTLFNEQSDLNRRISEVKRIRPGAYGDLYEEQRVARQPGWESSEMMRRRMAKERANKPRKHYAHDANDTSSFLERNNLIKRDDNKGNNVKTTVESKPGPLTAAEVAAMRA